MHNQQGVAYHITEMVNAPKAMLVKNDLELRPRKHFFPAFYFKPRNSNLKKYAHSGGDNHCAFTKLQSVSLQRRLVCKPCMLDKCEAIFITLN